MARGIINLLAISTIGMTQEFSNGFISYSVPPLSERAMFVMITSDNFADGSRIRRPVPVGKSVGQRVARPALSLYASL
jgi:hypothetical protein